MNATDLVNFAVIVELTHRMASEVEDDDDDDDDRTLWGNVTT